MIVNTVVSTPKPEFKQTFIEHMKELAVLVQAEDGCITYELFEDPNHRSRLLLFEEWESQAALEKHLAQPHMTKHHELALPWFDREIIMTTYDIAKTNRQVFGGQAS